MEKKNSTENCHFYSREKSLYIVWACFRNVLCREPAQETTVNAGSSPLKSILVPASVPCSM